MPTDSAPNPTRDTRSAPTMGVIDNQSFGGRLIDRVATAEDRVLIQVMTFDGDTAGLALAQALIEAAGRGVTVELLIDCYAAHVLSDTPARRASVQAEAAATRDMFGRLTRAGAAVTFTNPWLAGLLAATRNHKKIFVVDDVAYLGGINVSDHNYAWRDFNIEITDPTVVATLAEDFARTQRGERRSIDGPVITNRFVESTFESIVSDAKQRVIISSPYALDLALVRTLERSRASERILISPEVNNFAAIRATDPYLRHRLVRAGVKLVTYPDFFHEKFVLADDGPEGGPTKLLVGSSNFGRHSFRCNEEVGLVITDPAFVAAFRDRALGDVEPLHSVTTPGQRAAGLVAAHALHAGVSLLGAVVAPRVPPLAHQPRSLRTR